MTRLLITCMHLQRHVEAFRAELEAVGVEPVVPDIPGQQLDGPAMRDLIGDVDVVIAGDDVIDADVLERGRSGRLRAVVKWGIGTDSIDKAAASRLGVPVFNTPGVFSDEVADLAMSFLLLLTRRLHLMHRSVLEGGWLKVEGRSLAGMTAGVVGLGSIGLGIARRCAAAGMRVIGHDVGVVDPARLAAAAATLVPFDRLLRESDAILLACNLTPENRHLLDRAAFAAMRPGVYVVNVARGPLIEEAALVEALGAGRVGGAGLDVFEDEPLPMSSPLRHFDTCVFGTHNGSNTREAVERVNRMTVDIALDVLGIRPAGFVPNRVNPC